MNTEQQLSLFSPEEMGGFSLQEVLEAYRVCLRGKSGTFEAQKFGYRYMSECVQLWRSLNNQTYQLSLFIAFISLYPVMREIYGSKFVDRPELNCIRKGSPRDWDPMPPDKLLGSQGPRRGFPIGKVISQLSALMYIDTIDHLITYVWKILNGHYMDDRVMVDKSLEKLQEAKKELDQCHVDIGLRTHPRKTYLQHYTKGVLFGGAMIMPGRTYVSNRTVGNCFRQLARFNYLAQTEAGYAEQHAEEFASTLNSYFGQMGHHAEWNTMHRIISEIDSEWFKVMMVVGKRGRYKVYVHPPYRQRQMVVRKHRCRMITLLNNEDHRRSMRLTA